MAERISGLDYKRMNARMRMERVSAGYESLDTFLQVMKGVTGYTVSRNTAYSFEGGVINKRTGDKVGKKPDLSYLVAFCLTLCADQRKGRYWGDLLVDILIDSMPDGFEKEKCELIRCRDCMWLGRESIVPGEYRCNRTERVTELDDYCSKAVRRDEHKGC